MRAFGEGFMSYRPPVDLKTITKDVQDEGDTLVLNFITPHQKWGIHSTYSDNLLMLTLNRGGPVVWISEVDAKKAGIVDNDWIELYNVNGALTARAVVSQRIKEGSTFMYHAQEKIVNTPGSEKTGNRGGIHNSVTRTTLKPTHMIGAYAQQSYGFNYYGTVGSNRDLAFYEGQGVVYAVTGEIDDEKERELNLHKRQVFRFLEDTSKHSLWRGKPVPVREEDINELLAKSKAGLSTLTVLQQLDRKRQRFATFAALVAAVSDEVVVIQLLQYLLLLHLLQ